MAYFIEAGVSERSLFGKKEKMKTNNRNLTKTLVESSLMIAFATVLSMLKLAEMPYGGSVTVASMVPMAFIAHRHGILTGLGSGVVYAAIQQLLGLNSLSYVTGWQSVLAVIMLDYILAFTVVGFAGVFKGRLGTQRIADAALRQKVELGTGMALACVLRYILHTVAGATVWAGLSIPTEAALFYSIGYNATYMIPETVVNVLVAVWLGGIIDFSKDVPVRFAPKTEDASSPSGALALLPHLSVLVVFLAVIVDSVLIFPYLQHPEDGSFTLELLSKVKWVAVILVSVIALLVAVGSYVASRLVFRKEKI